LQRLRLPRKLFVEYNAGFINKLPLDGSGTVSPVLDLTGKAGPGMAIDQANGKIYFSDFEVTGEGKIWRMNLDGSGLEAIVNGLTDPYGIALDVAAGKVYWTDDAGNVSRSNLDGTNQQIGIVNIAGGQMRAVALDPAHNKMYFYEVNLENLYVADLDGSNSSVLIAGVYGYAILVDTQNGKIYYDNQNANGGDGALVWANLDGTGPSNIFQYCHPHFTAWQSITPKTNFTGRVATAARSIAPTSTARTPNS